jgi:tRNA nucleotidyltransferase (CCA-adding enzyme)
MSALAEREYPPHPSEIYDHLHWVHVETCLAYLVVGESRQLREVIRKFLKEIKPTKLEINGQDFKDLGFPPSPAYKTAFNAVYRAKLDGKVTSRQEELDLAREVLQKEFGEPNKA